jgi:predicted lipoprotein with Yx(FWY)xxD motif
MTTIMYRRAALAAGLISFGLLVAACGSSSSSTPAAGGSSSPAGASSPTAVASSPAAATSSAAASAQIQLKTAQSSLGTVLTNTQGFTVYWFAKDSMTASNCSGACAVYWPPVIGTPVAASGVTLPGKLGTITRSDGSLQATYDGHPLYLFKGDSAAGQTSGNGVTGFGALWYAVTASGSTPAAPTGSRPSASASSKGYGY